MKYEAREYYVK